MSKRRLTDHYVPRINSEDEGYKILDWESRQAHFARFDILISQVLQPMIDETTDHREQGLTLLDIGCGVGDLYGYVKRGIDARGSGHGHPLAERVQYTGVDIIPEMVHEAARRYPEGLFLQGDIFTDQDVLPSRPYDIIYSSGIFNLNLGNNREFLQSAIPIFFKLASRRVVFNLLDPDHPVKNDAYAFFDPVEVLEWVRPYSRHVCIVRDYLPGDFTVIARVEH